MKKAWQDKYFKLQHARERQAFLANEQVQALAARRGLGDDELLWLYTLGKRDGLKVAKGIYVQLQLDVLLTELER